MKPFNWGNYIAGFVLGVLFAPLIYFSIVSKAQEATTTDEAPAIEDTYVAPEGTGFETPEIQQADIVAAALSTFRARSQNKMFKGAAEEIDNMTLLYGRLDYISDQIKQLQDACAR